MELFGFLSTTYILETIVNPNKTLQFELTKHWRRIHKAKAKKNKNKNKNKTQKIKNKQNIIKPSLANIFFLKKKVDLNTQIFEHIFILFHNKLCLQKISQIEFKKNKQSKKHRNKQKNTESKLWQNTVYF